MPKPYGCTISLVVPPEIPLHCVALSRPACSSHLCQGKRSVLSSLDTKVDSCVHQAPLSGQ